MYQSMINFYILERVKPHHPTGNPPNPVRAKNTSFLQETENGKQAPPTNT